MSPARRIPFLIYAACSLGVLGGLVWITLAAAGLEARERRARADAALNNAIGIALYRMDSAFAPYVWEQAGHPYFEYRPFYSAERAYTRMFEEILPDEVLVPSPLLGRAGEFVHLHFQFEPDGRLTSPQVPTGDYRDQAVSGGHASEAAVLAAEERLAALLRLLGGDAQRRDLAWGENALLLAPPPPPAQASDEKTRAIEEEYGFRQQTAALARQSGKGAGVEARDEPQVLGAPEPGPGSGAPGAARPAEAVQQIAAGPADADAAGAAPSALPAAPPAGAGPDGVMEEPLRPEWLTGPEGMGPQLLFVRVVRLASGDIRQGFWVDWPRLRVWLLEKTRDLLPRADLVPVYSRAWGDGVEAGRLLANVPALLVPGEVPVPPLPALTPTRLALGVTWLAVLLAVGAVGLVLRQSMDLAERRGRFVSAVTHELRTPLTTFCLYTQMLADGMVGDERTRAEYLGTLKGESGRLARIVENVLEFARLGRGRPARRARRAARAGAGPAFPADARAMLDALVPVLERRAAQGGMSLEVDAAGAAGVRLAADAQTIERILFNLVDNACKYAGDAADKRVHLRAARWRGMLEVSVADHGPGVPAPERSRIFAPFHRARRDSEGPSPGLGLGLALARGLARQLGGDLTLAAAPAGGGARFVLRVPAA